MADKTKTDGATEAAGPNAAADAFGTRIRPADRAEPSEAALLQGTVPDVLDPMAGGVTTMDRGAALTDGAVSTDPAANRPLKEK